MHFSNLSYVILSLLGGTYGVNIILSDGQDGSCSTSFARCDNIPAGYCCGVDGGNPLFGQAYFESMSSGAVRGFYNGAPTRDNSCVGEPLCSSFDSGCLECRSKVYGAMWAPGLGPQRQAMSPQAAKSAGASALKNAAKGNTIKKARPARGRLARFLRRSLDSNEDPPRNVGAVPNRPYNVGATPNDGPRNVGAVPNGPYNVGARPNDGPRNVGAVPTGPPNVGAVPNGPYNVGATPNYPWQYRPDNDYGDNWYSWLRGWGYNKAKREVGKTVAPNRATIAGHNFNLEAMPKELRSEMYSAIFNRTEFRHLSSSLLEFEIKEE